MKIEEKFNKRTAELLEVQPPTIHVGQRHSVHGLKATFFLLPGSDGRTLSMHMTPDEALQLAERLIASVLHYKRTE